MANSTAEFDCAALVRKFRPLIEPTISTPGVSCKILRTCLATSSVRCNDAPSGNWVHWILHGLPAERNSLPEGVPTSETLADFGGAKQGLTDFKKVGYGGPCPPKGLAHHYHFRLYALDAHIDLAPRATEAELTRAMQGHILAQAELVGLYSR